MKMRAMLVDKPTIIQPKRNLLRFTRSLSMLPAIADNAAVPKKKKNPVYTNPELAMYLVKISLKKLKKMKSQAKDVETRRTMVKSFFGETLKSSLIKLKSKETHDYLVQCNFIFFLYNIINGEFQMAKEPIKKIAVREISAERARALDVANTATKLLDEERFKRVSKAVSDKNKEAFMKEAAAVGLNPAISEDLWEMVIRRVTRGCW
jgi:hypothetical protein